MKSTQQKLFSNLLKAFTLLLFTMFTFQIEMVAQPGPHGRQEANRGRGSVPDSIDVKQMVKHMSQELELSEDQQLKITDLSQAHFALVRQERKTKKEAHIKERESGEKTRKEFESQIKDLLDEDQASKWEELQGAKKEGHKPRRPRH